MNSLVRNSFVSPVSRSAGVDLSADEIIVTELIDFVEKGPSGEASDFVIYKKPIEVERYHHNKVMANRAKGASLKEIIAQCDKTGDYSTLTQRKVVFGDEFLTPKTLGDAFDLAEKGAQVLDSMSVEERDRLLELSKMSKSEFDAYIQDQVDAVLSKQKVTSEITSEEKGEK